MFLDEEKKFLVFFFFQAEDGIRDGTVTGVQTCALPIRRGTVSRVIVADARCRYAPDAFLRQRGGERDRSAVWRGFARAAAELDLSRILWAFLSSAAAGYGVGSGGGVCEQPESQLHSAAWRAG